MGIRVGVTGAAAIAVRSRAAVTPRAGGGNRPLSPLKDAFTRSVPPIRVVTFNTAGDGCRHTPEAEVPDAQPFQAAITGKSDAPIIAAQEVTAPFAERLGQLSRNGNFKVIVQGPTWLPSFLRASVFAQGNLLVVPKRYKVESVHWVNYKGRLGLLFQELGGVLFHHQGVNSLFGAIQKRGYVSVRLKDQETGKQFTVIATHLNGDDTVRRTEEPQLIAGIEAAKKQGPVTVMGDFNTPSEATNYTHDPEVAAFWKQMEAAGVTDQFPYDKTSGNQDIDHVLTAGGFRPVGDEVYNGSKLTIPGRHDASQVSDHYAHGVDLQIPG